MSPAGADHPVVNLAADARERWADASPAALDALLDVEPGVHFRRTPRGETFPWPATDPTLVVKRFAADLGSERWYERLRHGAVRTPAEREHAALEALAAGGFPVPPAVGWARRGARSVVVLGLVPHKETLRQRLARGPEPGLEAELAELVARLHDAGWYHRDLYLEHVALPDAGAPLLLLDLGRARRERAPRRRWFVKDLAALEHSAPDAVDEGRRCAFLERYLAARGRLSERAAWAARVTRHARRMARHAPRHVDPGSREGGVG